MKPQHNHYLILENDHFKEIMLEAKDLIKKSEKLKYSLMHEESLNFYDSWAPYVLDDMPSTIVNSPGFKISFLQVMSNILALKGEQEEPVKVEQEEPVENQDNKIINFLAYKSSKNPENIYSIKNRNEKQIV